MRKPKKLLGNELLLPTDAGEVRVIGCNLDNPHTLPLFVDMHGDGFVLGHAEMDDPFMARVAEATGIKILSIDYSLAPHHPLPEALDECYGVVKYAKEHSRNSGSMPGTSSWAATAPEANLAPALLDAERHELGLNQYLERPNSSV